MARSRVIVTRIGPSESGNRGDQQGSLVNSSQRSNRRDDPLWGGTGGSERGAELVWLSHSSASANRAGRLDVCARRVLAAAGERCHGSHASRPCGGVACVNHLSHTAVGYAGPRNGPKALPLGLVASDAVLYLAGDLRGPSRSFIAGRLHGALDYRTPPEVDAGSVA